MPGDSQKSSDFDIKYYSSMERVIKDAEVVIAPMSSTDEEGFLKATFGDRRVKLDENFFDLMETDSLFLIGIARPAIKELIIERGIKCVELARLDEVAILNAIPTAEGVLKIAIEETDYTIYGSKTLVFGLGKVGLTLAWRLKALGAESYAVTRDRAAQARGKDLGIKMLSYDTINDYLKDMDIIFNTVPTRIITEKEIACLKNDTLIIDLASSPGGTDFEAARRRGIKALLALGLPGKVAPLTAGKILAEVIPDVIKEHVKV